MKDSLFDRIKAASSAARVPTKETDCLVIETVYEGLGRGDALDERAMRFLGADEGAQAPLSYEDCLFIDTETTGLSGGAGTLAFLVGAGFFRGDDFILTQYFMRDYGEESSLLNSFVSRAEGVKALISFNGRRFDLPLLENRCVINRIRPKFPQIHLDLIYPARRIFARRIKRCSLKELERTVLGFDRGEDLPGALVPACYFDFLKHGRISEIEPILHHNREDIVSLSRLMKRLCQMQGRPDDVTEGLDLYSLGRAFERGREMPLAKHCYRACAKGEALTLAQMRMADILRFEGRTEEATGFFEALRDREAADASVYIALAKIYEHKQRQADKALAIAHQGMVYCLSQEEKTQKLMRSMADLRHRIERLQRKVDKSDGHV